MPRIEHLPPPPAVPPVSPAVVVRGEREARVPGRAGGPSLEARVHAPEGAVRAVVLCHPHPLYGGSMHSPVPLALAKCLADHAIDGAVPVAWLRFNFRGVGASEGTYDDGRGEIDDALAAVDEARRLAPGARISLCGHSFGSFVSLRAAARDGRIDRLLLLAPSTRFFAFREPDAPNRGQTPASARAFVSASVSIFVGDQDDLCDVGEAGQLAEQLGAELRVFQGFDHHFTKSRRAMAEAALPVIAPEVTIR